MIHRPVLRLAPGAESLHCPRRYFTTLIVLCQEAICTRM